MLDFPTVPNPQSCRNFLESRRTHSAVTSRPSNSRSTGVATRATAVSQFVVNSGIDHSPWTVRESDRETRECQSIPGSNSSMRRFDKPTHRPWNSTVWALSRCLDTNTAWRKNSDTSRMSVSGDSHSPGRRFVSASLRMRRSSRYARIRLAYPSPENRQKSGSVVASTSRSIRLVSRTSMSFPCNSS
jgi:hypothetical protein